MELYARFLIRSAILPYAVTACQLSVLPCVAKQPRRSSRLDLMIIIRYHREAKKSIFSTRDFQHCRFTLKERRRFFITETVRRHLMQCAISRPRRSYGTTDDSSFPSLNALLRLIAFSADSSVTSVASIMMTAAAARRGCFGAMAVAALIVGRLMPIRLRRFLPTGARGRRAYRLTLFMTTLYLKPDRAASSVLSKIIVAHAVLPISPPSRFRYELPPFITGDSDTR